MKASPPTSILVAIMSSRENTGMALGLLGVVIFSLTLPFTRIVVQELHPLLNGLGRALFAAIPAALLLLWRREKWPTWKQVKGLTLVIAGVILGFPVLSSWAMQTLPASHGALVNGLQPLCVAQVGNSIALVVSLTAYSQKQASPDDGQPLDLPLREDLPGRFFTMETP